MLSNFKYTILVIDDEDILRESIVSFLEDRDYKVLQAENGKVGIELFKTNKPDIVITDLRMPEIDGLEVLKVINNISPDVPLIVISGTGRIEDSVEALRSGAWDYILKPVLDMTIISHSVNRSLERSYLIQQNRLYQEKLELLVKERTEKFEFSNTSLKYLNSRLRKVVEITQILSRCDNLSSFVGILLKQFSKLMSSTGGSLFFIEKEGLRLIKTIDQTHVPKFIHFPLVKSSILEHVLNDKRPQLIKDVKKLEKFSPSGWDGYLGREALIFPLLNEDNDVIAVLTLHNNDTLFKEQDIEIGSILSSFSCETLRVLRANESMMSSEEKFKIIFNSSRDAILLFDPVKKCFDTDCNIAALKLFEFDSKEDLFKYDYQFLLPKLQPDNKLSKIKFNQMIDKAMNEGSHYFEWIFLNKNKKEFVTTVLLTEMKLNNRVFLQTTIKDITEQKELEENYLHTQKMEAIGLLAGGVAHDFNNLLTSIIGAAQLLKISNPPLGEKNVKYIEMIMKSSQRASDLTKKLLTFSRKGKNVFVKTDVAKIISETLVILNSTIDKNIEIITKENASSYTIMGSSSSLQNVLMNLCINSSHAMAQGGKISITSKNIFLDKKYCDESDFELKPGNFIEIEVSDNGEGIPDSIVDKIFEPFFTTKEEGKGTGLGLAAVYGTIKSHNGMISFSTEVNQGTVFTLRLPCLDENVSFLDIRDKIYYGFGKVMIIDDEEIVLETSKDLVEMLGYEVIIARDGEEAVEIFQEKYLEIDVVLLDMIMPKLDGKKTFYKLLEIDKNSKIIVNSGFADAGDIKEMKKDGLGWFYC